MRDRAEFDHDAYVENNRQERRRVKGKQERLHKRYTCVFTRKLRRHIVLGFAIAFPRIHAKHTL